MSLLQAFHRDDSVIDSRVVSIQVFFVFFVEKERGKEGAREKEGARDRDQGYVEREREREREREKEGATDRDQGYVGLCGHIARYCGHVARYWGAFKSALKTRPRSALNRFRRP